MPNTYDVSFVGQAHGERNTVIRRLQQNVINVVAKGTHWNLRKHHIYLRKLRMISDSFFQSVINSSRVTQEEMIEIFQRTRINLNLTASSQDNHRNQIKGRTFEIPGSGGFQLSEYADRIEDYFHVDKEIVCFKSFDEMKAKIKYYLDHEEERASIAEAGYRRAIGEHTYEKRFNVLFRQMGLQL